MVKVLIVDDEKLERILIRNGFHWEEHGFEIIGEASSGAEALEIIEEKQPHLVLTDINMPNMSGIELVEKIRQTGNNCRIVIITGYREFDYARKAVRLGVEDFLLKPLDVEEIGTVVKNIRESILAEQLTNENVNAQLIQGNDSAVSINQTQQELDAEQIIEKEVSIDWKEFIYVVQNCMQDRATGYVQEYVERIRMIGMEKDEYLRLLAMHMLSKAEVTLHEYGKSYKDIPGSENLYGKIGRITNLTEMQDVLIQVVEQFIGFHREIGGKKKSELIGRAVEYIEQNMNDPELSLKSVAAAVYTNESYLSRVFKKEMGESLIEYITKKRIAESIRLLNTTNLKVYEIAEQVGFRDSHYFSICFKKQVGETIKDFKNKKK